MVVVESRYCVYCEVMDGLLMMKMSRILLRLVGGVIICY